MYIFQGEFSQTINCYSSYETNFSFELKFKCLVYMNIVFRKFNINIQMSKISGKYCLINLLSYLEYSQVKILLFRASKALRRQLFSGFSQIKNVCTDTQIEFGEYSELTMYYDHNDRDKLFIATSTCNRLIKECLYGQIRKLNVQIVQFELLKEVCTELSLNFSKLVSANSVNITGEYEVALEISDRLKQVIESHFVNPNYQWQLNFFGSIVNRNQNYIKPFSFENLTMNVSNYDPLTISLGCLKHIKKLNINVISNENYLEFHDIE